MTGNPYILSYIFLFDSSACASPHPPLQTHSQVVPLAIPKHIRELAQMPFASSCSLGGAASGTDSVSGSHSTAQHLQANTDSFLQVSLCPKVMNYTYYKSLYPETLVACPLSSHTLLAVSEDIAVNSTETFLPY